MIVQLGIPDVAPDRTLRDHVVTLRHWSVPTSIIKRVGPAPLVDDLARNQPRRGRPSRRPEGMPQRVWEQWLRNVSTRGYEDTPEAMARWMVQRQRNIIALRLRLGWDTRREAHRDPEVVWVAVVHRKDLTEQLEQEWRRRIARRRPGEPIYRIHLRGIQRREVR